MKQLIRTTCMMALFAIGMASSAHAQALVSTGRIVGISPKHGTISLRTNQGYVITYEGMNSAPIQYSTGTPAAFRDLQVEGRATVYYAGVGNRWLVSKVVIEPPASGSILPPIAEFDNEYPGLPRTTHRQAPLEGNITTGPAVPAGIEGDATRQPGRAEDRPDVDVTRRPASVDPDFDDDITTHR